MGATFSDAQWALLTAPDRQAKVCLEIGLPTELRYCSGQDAVTHDAHLFTPRGMRLDDPEFTTPESSAWQAEIDDADEVLYNSYRNYRSTWESIPITLWLLGRHAGDGPSDWLELFEWSWYFSSASRNDQTAVFRLVASCATGLNPSAILMLADLDTFPHAPGVDQKIIVGSPFTGRRSVGFSYVVRPDPETEDVTQTTRYGRRARGRVGTRDWYTAVGFLFDKAGVT